MTNKCGFIAVIGRPNVGKSTLVNHLVGNKISITSRKPQTTRHTINGILTANDRQYVFVDTPGFQKLYSGKLNSLLNASVVNSLNEVDVILFVVEAGVFNLGDEEVLKLLPPQSSVILVINKQDKIKEASKLKKYMGEIKAKFKFCGVCRVAAKYHNGLEPILSKVGELLPNGPFLYDEEQLTDRSSNFLVSEIIREKLFRYLGEELPYEMAVTVEEFKLENDVTKIAATIWVTKANLRGMVIGKEGAKLKKISTEARIDIEKLLDTKVFLQVWVKVKAGFIDKQEFLQQFNS